MYIDNQKKFVAVLNRQVAMSKLLNALGHLTVDMQARCGDPEVKTVHRYEGPDGSLYATISNWPFIILQAKNGNQLRTLWRSALGEGVTCQAFTGSMLGQSAEDQLRQTRLADVEAVEFFAVVIFGDSEQLRPLTKKFSLFTSGNDVDHSSSVSNES